MYYKQDDKIFGKSYGEWTADWWKWFIKPIESQTVAVVNGLTIPLQSRLGEQDGDVAFVAGRFVVAKDTQVHQMRAVVRQDQAVLIPVDNWISLGTRWTRTSVLEKVAKERVAMVVALSLNVDDQVIPSIRVISPVFELDIKEESQIYNQKFEIGKVKKGRCKALSDGYWLFLKPNILEKGDHKVETMGSCATGQIRLEIHHTLNVI